MGENKNPVENVAEKVGEGLKTAAEKIEKAADEINEKTYEKTEAVLEKISKDAAPVLNKMESDLDTASEEHAEDIKTLGEIISNAEGSGAVTADSSDASPVEVPEELKEGLETLDEMYKAGTLPGSEGAVTQE